MTHDLDQARRERAAFASLSRDASQSAPDIDAETIWKAVSGELSAEQTGRLLDLAAESPEVAEAWRLARELIAAQAAADGSHRVTPLRRWPRRIAVPLGLAAALLLGIGLWPLLRDAPTPYPPSYRSAAEQQISSRIGDEAVLFRDRFQLKWTAGDGEGWRYELRVADDALRELLWVRDLAEPDYLVAPEALEAVASGSRIYWRVEAVHEDGRRGSSPTFVVTLQ